MADTITITLSVADAKRIMHELSEAFSAVSISMYEAKYDAEQYQDEAYFSDRYEDLRCICAGLDRTRDQLDDALFESMYRAGFIGSPFDIEF